MVGIAARSRVRAIVVVGSIFFILGTAMPTVAGQGTQASIIGQVKDESGAVLPGVTVTITSPALQVPSLTSVTNENGEYRLTPLPIGTYDVVFTLSGFQTVRHEGVRLTAGFVAREDVSLTIGSLSETITVSGVSPVVDVTSSEVATSFTKELLEATPTARQGLHSLMSQVPGVRQGASIDVGGSQVGVVPTVITQGRIGDAWTTIEGVATQSPKVENESGGYIQYDALEEVRAYVNGADVDAVRPGLKIDMLVKSGGNNFKGSVFTSYTNDNFQSDNVTDYLRSKGIQKGSPLVRRYDIGGDLGGRVIRDKLWFYGGASKKSSTVQPEFSKFPDGTPAPSVSSLAYYSAKLSYQVTPSNRLIGFANHYYKILDSGATQLVPYESRNAQDHSGPTDKIEWQGIRGSSLVASAQFGYWKWYGYTGVPVSEGIATTDLITRVVSGPSASTGRTSWEYRYHTKANVSYFKPDLLLGSHQFKTGFDYMEQTINSFNKDQRLFGGTNAVLVFSNGVPNQIQAFNYPSNPRNPVTVIDGYVADQWAPSTRLTLNLGLRYSHEDGHIEESCREATNLVAAECFAAVQFPIWQSLAPRLHASYALTSDNKTVVKGGWSRYPEMRGSDKVALANKHDSFTLNYRWRDPNGDRLYQPGEVDLSRTGPDFLSLSGRVANLVINPDETQPLFDEFGLAVEREVIGNLAVRFNGVYSRRYKIDRLENIARPYSAYNVPITRPDPGPDNTLGNADDAGTITYYDFPTALRAATATRLVYDPNADESYQTTEFQLIKRLANKWQLLTYYSTSKRNRPFGYNQGGGNDTPLTTLDPNAEINTRDRTRTHSVGFSGAYMLPFDISSSVNYQFQSGDYRPRTVVLTGGVAIPTITVNATLPEDSPQLENLHLMDVRVEKSFRLTGTHKASVRFNVYNLTNRATILTMNTASGPNYLLPTSILPPRIAEFSVLYSF